MRIIFSCKFYLILLIGCLIHSSAFALSPSFNKSKFISYTDTGEGKPLVLIHAFPTDQTLWDPQRDSLKTYFRVITLDLWGFGASQKTDGQAITMTEYADEVKQLLDQLHIEKAIIGGESMGGYIALAFLKHYPERVEGLVLSDTQSIADTAETKAKREVAATNVLEHGTTQLIQDFMPKALSSAAADELKISLRSLLDKQSASAMASALRGMAQREDTTDVLASTALPILILTGDQDTLISPQQSQNMRMTAKNSRLVIIQQAGHLSSFEQPEQWNKAVIEMFYKKNLF